MSQNIIISSDSGSGKTWITKGILKLFGEQEQDYYVVSRMTKNAINYYTDVNMDGKVIFIEELQGLDENTGQLRVWMSEGQISLLTVEKVKNADGIEVNRQSIKTTMGQPVFITNQAEGKIEDQLNNRSWVLSMDLSKEQTSQILSLQDKANRLTHRIDTLKIRKIKDALKQLKVYHFIIPFADHEALGIPIADIRARRDYQKFLTLIKCSAYLHQFQREKIKDDNGNEFLVCSIKDYEIAKRYSKGILGAVFSGLTTSQIDLINNIKNASWKHEFMISDLMRNFGKTQPFWFGTLNQLADLGFVTAQKSAGNSTIYSVVENKTINIINMPSGLDLLRSIRDDGGVTYNFIKNELENLTGFSYSEDTLQNSEVMAGNLYWGVKAFNEEIAKKPPITLLSLQKYNKFSTPSSFFIPKNDNLVIGGLGRSKLVEFMKKSSKHELQFHELLKSGVEEKDLDKLLNQLKSEGIIFEPRPGRYMLL
jgi:hypothetical protein